MTDFLRIAFPIQIPFDIAAKYGQYAPHHMKAISIAYAPPHGRFAFFSHSKCAIFNKYRIHQFYTERKSSYADFLQILFVTDPFFSAAAGQALTSSGTLCRRPVFRLQTGGWLPFCGRVAFPLTVWYHKPCRRSQRL